VEKLAKAKYQDNLELAQWLKRYYALNCGERGAAYRAEERRAFAHVDFSFADKLGSPKAALEPEPKKPHNATTKSTVILPKDEPTTLHGAKSPMQKKKVELPRKTVPTKFKTEEKAEEAATDTAKQ
jgi:hypothetical protein